MIHIEVKGIREAVAHLDPRKVDRAARSALVRVRGQAVTESAKLMSKEWNISRTDLLKKGSGKERIQASGYVGSDLTAHIYFYSGGISLAYFGAAEFRFKGGTLMKMSRKGAAEVRRGKGKAKTGVQVKLLRDKKLARLRAFFAAVKYGKDGAAGLHLGVFSSRKKGDEWKMYERKVISVASMIRRPKVMEPLQKFIYSKFRERFNHELKRQGLIT